MSVSYKNFNHNDNPMILFDINLVIPKYQSNDIAKYSQIEVMDWKFYVQPKEITSN